MSWLDLHMHSLYSDDGEYAPEALLRLCAERGVRTAAIADHNTAAGIQEASYYAFLYGVTLIPAIELDCTYQNVNLHVLGYFIDPFAPAYQKNYESILSQEMAASKQRMQLVQSQGIFLEKSLVQKLSNGGPITGEILAEAALAHPENKNNALLAPYRFGGARSDNPYVNFYWDYCAQGKPCYVPVTFPSLQAAVQMIKHSGGTAVLAHPGNNIHEDESLFSAILHEGVAGVEVYSSYHMESQVQTYEALAQKYHVFATAGSDFHGKTKPSITLGSAECGGIETRLLQGLLSAARPLTHKYPRI